MKLVCFLNWIRGDITMKGNRLDDVDRRILSDLQANGRITNIELSRRAGISAPPCLRRVRALEREGFIQGYHAEIDPKSLGYDVTVFAMVGLESQAEADLETFEQRCIEWPLVRECHMLAGEVDFLLKVVAHDWDEYQKFLTNELISATNVSQVKSSLSIRARKLLPRVPFENSKDYLDSFSLILVAEILPTS